MAAKRKEFTGKHMAMVFVGGFGIVIAVNLLMASFAVSGFHGVVVENSYVASQNFNRWLDKAEKSRALGWQIATERRADGRVVLQTEGVPTGAAVTAELRRPIGAKDFASLTFAQTGQNTWLSNETVAEGRWTMRMAIAAAGQDWAGESEIR
ncbi:MAG: putative integral membrane protein linked to a cation pump [Porphyrobacter sp. HL-46]|nr:MAG: putative integral membrane protein linked to a cation pump [Porphyrobacter sp. HL-46]